MTDIQTIANDSRVIFWDMANLDSLSSEAVTERILKYGTWMEVRKLIEVLDADFPKIAAPLVEKPRSIFTSREQNFIRHLITYASRHTR